MKLNLRAIGIARSCQSVLASVLLVVVAGCGGGGSDAGTPPFGGGTGTGGASAPTIAIELSSNTVTAAAPATVRATVKTLGGAAIPGQVVSFSTGAGLGSFSSTTALTDAVGVATVTLVPASSASSGADTVVASVTVNDSSVQAATGFQLTATNVAISSFTSDITTLSAYGQTALTVTLSGAIAGTPVGVSVSSSCVSKGRATLTPAIVTTGTGTASFTYRDAGCGAFDLIDGLQASVAGTAANASLQLTLTAPTAASISFISASPDTIFLRGSGFVENSNVTFQVRDANGAGVPNRLVLLEPTTLAGGLLIDGGSVPVVKQTDSEGKVLVRVNSGTVPTPVRIKALLQGSDISTVSSSLAIAVGLPSQLNFSLSQAALNIEGYNRDGTANTYTVIASDRLGNPVPEGTAMNFVTEGGQVQAIRFVTLANGLASATANFQSADPRPVDGRITVLSYALGEESFLDRNGNNVYDTGEDHQDLGDVFLDRLFNTTYNVAEDQFISLSIAGTQPCVDAASSLLRLNASSPSRRLSVAGAALDTCAAGWGRAYVRRAAQTVLSTSSARPVFGTALPPGSTTLQPVVAPAVATCPSINLITELGYTSDDTPTRANYFEVGSVALTRMGGSGLFSIIASDANPIAFNPMAAGTSVSATGTDGLSVNVVGGSPVPSTSSPSSVALTYKFEDGVSAGTVSVTFTSPSGLRSTVSQVIYAGAGPGTACP